MASKPKHPAGLPMTLGNMRELGVPAAFNDVRCHSALIDYRQAQGRCHRHLWEYGSRRGKANCRPIVFAAAGDPVGTGLVASLARPGGNVTGLSIQQTDLAGKRLEILRELVPGLHTLAILANAGSPNAVLEMGEAETVARS
jgi:hypothetical protein